ncbi:MAG: substrate-binding domain-containing protein [Gammaproteobacteria bacterium]|nr:substrate-binding domain-containing protein [Gammaproteobacteria bacterium]
MPALVLWLGVFASASAAERFITLASTTSTQASGLFDYLLPKFTEKTGVEVRVVAVGTGQALKLGEKGDADVLLVHDPAGEEKFVKQGYGVDRRLVMYNDFVIVGPAADPVHTKGGRDAVAAFKAIAQAKATFLSRGDDSGTHRQELRLWEAAGIDVKSASGTWYKELGAGMGAALNTAAGLDGYTMSDRATWLSFKNRARLMLLVEGDPKLYNQYSVILVNPDRHPEVKLDDARGFMDWLTSPAGQQAIGSFTVEGQVLFHPNAAGGGD